MALTPEQTFQRDLVIATGQGLLKGLMHRGRAVAEAEAVVAQTLDRRLEVARQIVAMDQADHPDDGREQRLANLGQLMEAVVYAATSRGQSATDALNQANRQRDRLFVSAKGPRDEATPEVVSLTMTLKASVMQGRLMAGADFDTAHSEARQAEDSCLSIARRLHEINQADYPALNSDLRLRGVGQLFAASVTGSLQRQERVQPPQRLLRDVYDKHTALFASVQRTLDTQLERQLAAQAEAPSHGLPTPKHTPPMPTGPRRAAEEGAAHDHGLPTPQHTPPMPPVARPGTLGQAVASQTPPAAPAPAPETGGPGPTRGRTP